jgi:hypothetical protein
MNRFYISARKEGTEDAWQFVNSGNGPFTEEILHGQDNYALKENQVEHYLEILHEKGYETVVTERTPAGIDITLDVLAGLVDAFEDMENNS